MAGYIQIMEVQNQDIRALMFTHFVEPMADGKLYAWEAAPAFHTVWLQQMEQGQVSRKDTELKLWFRCSLVWYNIAPA